MNQNIRALLARVIGVVMALALSVCVLACVIWVLGTSASIMQRQFEQHAPPPTTGLSGEHYPAMAAMITGYLAGSVPEFQYAVDGLPQFHDYEQQHMADCLTLFQLDKRVLWISAGAALAALAAALLLRDRRRTAFGCFLGSTLVLLAVAVIGVLGAIDFDSLFVLFHQLSFNNGLWLLDPHTDLLIRLMPIGFFISYAAIGLSIWIGALVVMTGVSGVLAFRHKR